VYRVLVADRVDMVLVDMLRSSGFEVDYRPGISRDELISIIGDYDVLVVRGRLRIDGEVLKAAGRLRVIARAGVGLDNIDLDYARKLGVRVVNAPAAPTQSVAELTIGLMIAAARRVVELNYMLRSGGVWRKGYGVELYGKRLLVVGFGRIGRRVAEIAKAIGMRVYAYDVVDVSGVAEAMGVGVVGDLREGIGMADVVSLHVPLTPDTYHMVNSETIEWFREGAILVNTSRGAVVDAAAVLRGLEEGRLYAYAADVLEHEPPATEAEWRLVRHPRVVLTPHIGSQTREAQRRVAVETAKRIMEVLGVGQG